MSDRFYIEDVFTGKWETYDVSLGGPAVPSRTTSWVRLIADTRDDIWAAIELLMEVGFDVRDLNGPGISSEVYTANLYRCNRHR